MKIAWRYLLASLALAALAVLAFLRPDLAARYLMEPVVRLVWWLFRLLAMISQEVYWAFLIFAAFALLVRLVPARTPSGRAVPRPLPPSTDRIAYWEDLYRAARTDPEARRVFEQALRDLASSTAPEQGEDTGITLPPLRRGLWAAARARWPWLPLPSRSAEARYARQVEQIISTLETRMEMHHDRSDRSSPGD